MEVARRRSLIEQEFADKHHLEILGDTLWSIVIKIIIVDLIFNYYSSSWGGWEYLVWYWSYYVLSPWISSSVLTSNILCQDPIEPSHLLVWLLDLFHGFHQLRLPQRLSLLTAIICYFVPIWLDLTRSCLSDNRLSKIGEMQAIVYCRFPYQY